MEVSGTLFDVGCERYEVFVDEGGGFFVAVRFGFQPNACASGGSGAEVDQYRTLTRLRFRERRIGVVHPVHFHDVPPMFVAEVPRQYINNAARAVRTLKQRGGRELRPPLRLKVCQKLGISDDARRPWPGLPAPTCHRGPEHRSPCASTDGCSIGTCAIRPGDLNPPWVLLQSLPRE